MRKRLILSLAAIAVGILSMNAQVRIGGNTDPHSSAVLDLNASDETNVGGLGLALPRVTLTSTSDVTTIKSPARGLTVYNTSNIDASLYPGLYIWNGEQWSTSQANPSAGIVISTQPKSFTFYETGEETVAPLEVGVSGAAGEVTYQWYLVTGNNLHVRIGTKVSGGTGGTTASYTPTQVLKGTTKNANNTGFYRFYCVVEDSYGKRLESDIAEIAVGCGAKNNLGEWISFMCFNLGASEHTIAAQINHAMTFSPVNDANGRHYYISGEEEVYGDLYQWGRIGDGHEKRGADAGFIAGERTEGTNQAVYDMAAPPTYEDGNLIGTSQRYPWRQVSRTDDTYYSKFITTTPEQNFNWAYNLPASQIDQLWKIGRFAANDPCAKINADGLTYETYYPEQDGISGSNANWRMPTQAEWGEIYKGGALSGHATSATANTWVWNSTNGRGMEVRPDGKTTTLFLPASGIRGYSNGALYHQGTGGYYWSSSIIGINAYQISFASSIHPATSNARGYGATLRCIKNN